MSSLTQQVTLQTFGFSAKYSEGLPHIHAQHLIAQLYYINRIYFKGNLPALVSDIKESLAQNRTEQEIADLISTTAEIKL